MTQTSRWATGTYELVLDFSGTDGDDDIIATVFAMPADNTQEADDDAPILAQAGYIIPELGTLQGAPQGPLVDTHQQLARGQQGALRRAAYEAG